MRIASGERSEGRTTQGWVPVLWRGCSAGCLGFLEDGEGSSGSERGDLVSDGEEIEEGSLEWDSEELELDVPAKTTRWDGGLDELSEGSESEDSLDLEVKASGV